MKHKKSNLVLPKFKDGDYVKLNYQYAKKLLSIGRRVNFTYSKEKIERCSGKIVVVYHRTVSTEEDSYSIVWNEDGLDICHNKVPWSDKYLKKDPDGQKRVIIEAGLFLLRLL